MEDKESLHIDSNSSDELVLKHGDSVHVRLGNDSDYICLFKPDGSIEINPKYTVDEAAKEFWKQLIQNSQTVPELITAAEHTMRAIFTDCRDEEVDPYGAMLVRHARKLQEVLKLFGIPG